MNIKAILFDMDGTLTKYNLNYYLARVKIADELNALNINSFKIHQGMNINSMLTSVEHKIPETDYNLLLGRIYAIMSKYELEFAKKVEILPGVQNTLQILKNYGLKIAIVTNNGRAASKKVIDKFSMHDLIDVLITREDVYRCKPNGEMVKKAMDILKVKSNETLFVGDSIVDILAARNSSVLSVAVPSGPTKSIDLINNLPNYVVQYISDIPILVDGIRTETN